MAGTGAPITQHVEEYSDSDSPIILYDTKGYEIGSDGQKEFINGVVDFATHSLISNSPLHIAWYCIQAPSSRIQNFDLEIINRLRESRLPIALVLTKSDLVSDEDIVSLRKTILSAVDDAVIFETSIKKSLNYLQVEELCDWSITQLPDSLRISFAAAQRQSLKLKKQQAHEVILQHSAASGFVGFSPIPFSDAPLLISNQAGMIARILYIYDLESHANKISELLGPTTIATMLSSSGKWLASQLIKLIPGIGQTVGGAINATVAASLTYGVGTTLSIICTEITEKVINNDISDLKKYMDALDGHLIRLLKESFLSYNNKGSE